VDGVQERGHHRGMTRLADCCRLLNTKPIWGNFPRKMRAFFLAQRGGCPYCGSQFDLAIQHGNVPNMECASWDHVFPRARHKDRERNVVLAHRQCNSDKSNREPRPCEVLFCEFVWDIIDDIARAAPPQFRKKFGLMKGAITSRASDRSAASAR
jgi:hypothetical protein